LETEEDMTNWASLRAFDEFERHCDCDACVFVSAMPDPAVRVARTP
jgi:hypothetical protein